MKQSSHESQAESPRLPPGHGTAHVDDIVEESEKVNELGGRKVSDCHHRFPMPRASKGISRSRRRPEFALTLY
jgi:hypothetical protein